MNFKVYVVLEIPLLDEEYELLIPVDRRIHDVIRLLKENMSEFSSHYYQSEIINIFNKDNGKIYDMNEIIKNSDIKNGTRLLLI